MVDPQRTRQLIYFQGHVQGVGFRFTTCRVAAQFRTSRGYVRNLADGRVEVVAEGTPGEVRRFVDRVRETMSGYIRHVDVHTLPATGEFGGFDIRH